MSESVTLSSSARFHFIEYRIAGNFSGEKSRAKLVFVILTFRIRTITLQIAFEPDS